MGALSFLWCEFRVLSSTFSNIHNAFLMCIILRTHVTIFTTFTFSNMHHIFLMCILLRTYVAIFTIHIIKSTKFMVIQSYCRIHLVEKCPPGELHDMINGLISYDPLSCSNNLDIGLIWKSFSKMFFLIIFL